MIINRDELLKNCANNERIVRRLLEIFLQQAPLWVTELQEAFSRNDAESVRLLCHRIKGGASTVQASAISEAASELGALAKSGIIGDDPLPLEKLVATIDFALEHVRQLLAAQQ